MRSEYVQTIVIGGGQAGLATGYHLARRGLPFSILDAGARVGDAWRNRWDSLRLFTPARYAGLPGMAFPGRGSEFATKDQVADYLESYAARFRLPVRGGERVESLARERDRLTVTTSSGLRLESDQVVVAMANYQVPRIPAFARDLDPGIRQLHSRDYRNPSQLADGPVLVVGAGNSGADIGIEVARTHRTWLAGKEPGHIPFRIETLLARHVLVRLVRFLGHHVLTLGTPMGRKVRPRMLRGGTPLVRVKPADLLRAGIERAPRVVGVRGGKPLLEGGRTLDVATVIWCTGFEPGFSWIHLPAFDARGEPVHHRGVARVPGLYFVGLHFQYAASSATLIGVGRDADHVVGILERRIRVARGGPLVAGRILDAGGAAA
jgi:putative flavoprotein involved in K+ transport